MTDTAASIDIGSTWTKGALFNLRAKSPRLIAREDTATTPEDLFACYNDILTKLKWTEGIPVTISSSAKGGLSIAAVGIVPDLTVQAAKTAALNAGGKLLKTYSYYLTEEDRLEIEALSPDIILFTGGTDGGSIKYNCHNAEILSGLPEEMAIIYGGNRSALDHVKKALKNHNLTVTENVLPAVDTVNPEPARKAIREIFLEEIVTGKGLDKVSIHAGSAPLPTPRAVFELLEAMVRYDPAMDNTCIIDPGGATTDCYSCVFSQREDDRIVARGLPEPPLSRTVEGDLGMRRGVNSLIEETKPFIKKKLDEYSLSMTDFDSYSKKIHDKADLLPQNREEKLFERILAQGAAYTALTRHCGTIRETYSPAGKMYIKRGKDLSTVKRIIGTGGYLSRYEGLDIFTGPIQNHLQNSDTMRLLPREAEYWRDSLYLFPLLGSAVTRYREGAVRLALHHLKRQEIT